MGRSVGLLVLSMLGLLSGCAEGGGEASQAPSESSESETVPPDSDVYVADLRGQGSDLIIGVYANVTDRPGYDNQPAFTPDGSALLYTAADGAGQADIMRVDLETGAGVLLTQTFPESEYSATPLPDGSGFSVIRVEADSTQRLWKFDWDGSPVEPILPDVAPAGYHAWSGMDQLVLFVLGDPPTLQLASPGPGEGRVADEAIGRSLQPIPGTREVSYVRLSEGGGTVMAIDPESGDRRTIGPTIGDGQDHAWTPGGVLLMGNGGVVHRWDSGASRWVPVAMEQAFEGEISRLAVSADGRHLAFVGVR